MNVGGSDDDATPHNMQVIFKPETVVDKSHTVTDKSALTLVINDAILDIAVKIT